MRSKKENDSVLQLARQVGKPVIGGATASAAGQFGPLADASRKLSGVCRRGQRGPRRIADSAHILCAPELEDLFACTLFHRPLPEHRLLPRPAGRQAAARQNRASGPGRICLAWFSERNLGTGIDALKSLSADQFFGTFCVPRRNSAIRSRASIVPRRLTQRSARSSARVPCSAPETGNRCA